MPRFAANLTMLFTELSFLDRFAAAASAGFKAVEFLFPYEFDHGAIKRQLDRHGLSLVLHNLPAGNWSAGERGIACLPDRVTEFRAGVAKGIDYARALECRQVNSLAGLTPKVADPAVVHRTLVENLRYAAHEFNRAGLTLLVEAINTEDMPGFHLSTTKQALELVSEVGAPNLKLQFDIYHMHIMEGNVARTIETNLGSIAHVQIADHPGRNEPGTGEIDFPLLFAHLDRIGYSGWIGCEYKPRAGSVAGLGWLEKAVRLKS